MKYAKLVVVSLICVSMLCVIGCGKKKEEQAPKPVAPTTPKPTPVQEMDVTPLGDIELKDVFGDKIVDLSNDDAYQIHILAGAFSGEFGEMLYEKAGSIVRETYVYTDHETDENGEFVEGTAPTYGRLITLSYDGNGEFVLEHKPCVPDFSAFKNWYDTEHQKLMDAYNAATSSSFTYDEEGNAVDLGNASAYLNQAEQFESKYAYYLDSKSKFGYYEGDYKNEPTILEAFTAYMDMSNFDPKGKYLGASTIDYDGDGTAETDTDKYELTSADNTYTYIAHVDKFSNRLISLEKLFNDGGANSKALAEITIYYDISDDLKATMPVVNKSTYEQLTESKLNSYVKQVTCRTLPVFDARYVVSDFNIFGLTSIKGMFDGRDNMITAELIKFGEDNGNFVNFNNVIWSSLDSENKSVTGRFIYQDTPVSFTLTPDIIKDENDNKKDDTYRVLVQTTTDRNSNTWLDADNVTDDQKFEIYDIAYDNLNILKDYEMLPPEFNFDIDTFTTWYDNHGHIKPTETVKSEEEVSEDEAKKDESEDKAEDKADEKTEDKTEEKSDSKDDKKSEKE